MKSRPKTTHIGDVTMKTMRVMNGADRGKWVTITTKPDAVVSIQYGQTVYETSGFAFYPDRAEACWNHYWDRSIYEADDTPVGSYPQPLKVAYLHRRRR